MTFWTARRYVPASSRKKTGSLWKRELSAKLTEETYKLVERAMRETNSMVRRTRYDNTRIIVVSDHGHPISSGLFENNQGFIMNKEAFQAVLLFKDFNSTGKLSIDNTFMTNADTPSLALKDIVDNPINPFTNNPINVENKNDYIKISQAPMQSLRTRDDKQFTIKDDEWLTVHDDIFKNENWSHYYKSEAK